MTREEAIEYNKNLREYMKITDKKSKYKFLKENYEALDMAIQALSQEPCDDVVSRERAKQFLYERLDRLNDDELYDIFSRIIDDMYNELPSATQKSETVTEFADRCRECGAKYGKMLEQKSGKWMLNKEKSHFFDVYECSNCGKISGLTNYCPNCGSKNDRK